MSQVRIQVLKPDFQLQMNYVIKNCPCGCVRYSCFYCKLTCDDVDDVLSHIKLFHLAFPVKQYNVVRTDNADHWIEKCSPHRKLWLGFKLKAKQLSEWLFSQANDQLGVTKSAGATVPILNLKGLDSPVENLCTPNYLVCTICSYHSRALFGLKRQESHFFEKHLKLVPLSRDSRRFETF